ncbi:MAG TPA: UDP-forming cellulose synthase catalytic subunit [Microvirga sp.]|jgi:cellulose synthase (UDP-forming)
MLRAVTFAAWALLALAALTLIAQPLSIASQLALGTVGLILMMVIRVLRLDGFWKQLFFAVGGMLVLRYVYWRTTSTLPSPNELQDFIPGVVLYIAEMYCVAFLAINLFVIASPINRRRAPAVTDQNAPTVDVFIPSYNEGKELLAATLSAAKAMIYPAGKLTVYLLDDGGTDEKVNSDDPEVAHAAMERRLELQKLARDLDVVYLTRSHNQHAKAGNLTNGLAHSTGEFVAVFDADHAPSREFLLETVGHFRNDDRLFLVQTPHFFLNPDPIEKNLATFSRMPSENEMFYGLIQKGLDKWNSAFFCGSAAVLRRAALEEAGGFAGTSITEDAETALELHARGWNSLYVDKPLIAGLQPETFASFIGQRSRWCRGMIQILLLKNPLTKAGLSVAQRICYLSSSMFWMFPVTRAIFLLAPLMYLFFNLQIYNASMDEFIAYTAVYLAAALVMQNYNYGRFRWPWVSELYEYVQSVYLLPAIISVIRNPRRPSFNVTAKGVTTDEDHLSSLAWPYFAVFGLLVCGVIATIVRLDYDPEARGLLIIVGLWNAFNLVIASVALGVVCERRERRRMQRVPINLRGVLHLDEGSLPVVVEDISLGGLKLRPISVSAKIPVRKEVAISLQVDANGQSLGGLKGKIVNARADGSARTYGLMFGQLEPVDYKVLAELMYADLTLLRRVRQARQRVRSLLAGTAQIFVWGARHSVRALFFVLFRRGTRAAPTTATAN